MAASIRLGSDDEESVMEINMTPLIDVMLVLLIYLIINLPPATHAVKMDLPRESGERHLKTETIDLIIDYDGRYYWNGTLVTFDALQAYLYDAGKKNPKPELHVTPNPHAKYEIVASVLAVAQRNGLEHIGFIGNERYME
jgi:biopolymer transport protein ExbD